MNTITIEFCKEDRQRIDELIAFAGLLVGEVRSYRDALKFQAPAQAPLVVEAQPPAEEHPADAPATHLELPTEPAPDPVPEVKPVSLAEFQKAVTQAVAKGQKQKAAAKAIINEYAPSVSEVPEDKRAEAMARLAKI